MFCSEIYKQSQYLELRLGGSREWAWAFCWSSLLWAWGKKGKPKQQNCSVRELFVPRGLKQRCDETPSAAGIVSQTQMLSSSDAFQRHVREHRQGSDDDQSLSQLGVSRARHQPAGSPGCLRGSAPASAHLFGILCALFSPQDHADSGLPHGPEELPHGRTDVHHAVRKLWVLCTSSFWRGDHLFSLLLSPAISFPSWNPFPAQPSLEACSRTSCLGFSIHSAHVTFAGEAKPQKIPCEEPWLACVYIGLSLRRREVKVLSAASGIFSLWMNICPLHMLLIPKEGKMMSFFQRKRSSWKK